MILEGIVTTTNADGSTNVSPMGPVVDESMQTLLLRPFKTSTTFANIRRTGEGIFHVIDDVELLAHAAVGTPDPLPELIDCQAVLARILANACRWYAFRVAHFDESRERASIEVNVIARGRIRDFFGLSRAKHAVVEAAILSTRTAILPAEQILADLTRLDVLVEKTGGPAEHRAMAFLRDHVQAAIADV